MEITIKTIYKTRKNILIQALLVSFAFISPLKCNLMIYNNKINILKELSRICKEINLLELEYIKKAAQKQSSYKLRIEGLKETRELLLKKIKNFESNQIVNIHQESI